MTKLTVFYLESMDDQAVVVSGRIKGSGFTFAVWLTVLSHLSTSDIGSLVTAFGLPLVPADAIRAHVVEQLIADNTVRYLPNTIVPSIMQRFTNNQKRSTGCAQKNTWHRSW